jgi:hypothetical protein
MTTAALSLISTDPACYDRSSWRGPVAGALDLTSALITNRISVPRSIAAGLIGIQAARSASVFP